MKRVSVVLLWLVVSCSPGHPDDLAPGEPALRSPAPVERPEPPPGGNPSRSVRVVAATPRGDLCVLDPDTGEKLSQTEARAVDVIAVRGGQGQVTTVEPGDEVAGWIAGYTLERDRLEPGGGQPFDALDGRLLDAGVVGGRMLFVGVALGEGATLFASDSERSVGQAWPLVGSALAEVAGDALRVSTVSLAGENERVFQRASVRPGSVERELRQAWQHEGVCGEQLFRGDGEVGVVRSRGGLLEVWTALDGGEYRSFEAPGSCVEAALAIEKGLVVVTGPAEATGPVELHWIEGDARATVVVGERGEAPRWLTRALAHDGSRRRVWGATGGKLWAVDLEGGPRLAIPRGGCDAASVTLVEGAPIRGS